MLDIVGPSTSDTALVNRWDFSGGADQLWLITPLGNGYSQILNLYSQKVLDVIGGSDADGTNIQQYTWLGGANQQWQIVPQGSSYNSIVTCKAGRFWM